MARGDFFGLRLGGIRDLLVGLSGRLFLLGEAHGYEEEEEEALCFLRLRVVYDP